MLTSVRTVQQSWMVDRVVHRGCSIWVYTMVATDYGGDQLLRHFIEHYHALGVPYDRFLFVLHHNPAYRDDPTSSEDLTA